LGVYQAWDGQEEVNAVKWAIESGYRHVDTAAAYGNEQGVGRGVAECEVPREELFVLSKVWNSDQGYDSTLRAFDSSLEKLKLEYLDLYLVHWPVQGKYGTTWKALERLYKEKRVRAIGVSNFLRHHLDDLLTAAEEIPMVNQMEFHPYLVRQDLLDYCSARGIQYEAWSPLMQGKIFKLENFKKLAERYGTTIAQIALRWDLQKGVVTIPKSTKKERIIENASVFDFKLTQEDMAYLDGMERGQRFGPDPDNFDF
jgi:diketogulonate reductase-like aldo/keto reductase